MSPRQVRCGSNTASSALLAWLDEHKFLRRHLSGNLNNLAHCEVRHRIKVAWVKFGLHSETLCNKNVSIRLRMRLFDSVVNPSLLFALAILPLHASCIEKLDVVQRKKDDFSR